MRQYDLFFTVPRKATFLSNAIRFFTRMEDDTGTAVTHCGVIWSEDLVIDSSWDRYGCGVLLRPFHFYTRKCNVHIRRIELTKQEQERFHAYLFYRIGDNYDVMQLVGNMVSRLHWWVKGKLWKQSPFDSDKLLTCSEFVSSGLESFGKLSRIGITVDPGQVSPAMLFSNSNLKPVSINWEG